jgi:DNA (cytosine-5)-methyltransferase 1
MVGVRTDLIESADSLPLEEIPGIRELFLAAKGLSGDHEVSAYEAISDLETSGARLEECDDSPGFLAAAYTGPRTSYQRLLHRGLNGTAPNSRRLVKHREGTQRRFELALKQSRRGVALSRDEKKELGIKRKHHFVILEKRKPSHTLTTLPDDLLHYSEPRVLTVREYARLQSFPDWFEFKGKYTTGGVKRKYQVPRYSQVANAVPPLMAEFLGFLLEVFSLSIRTLGDGRLATVRKTAERRELALRSPEHGRIFEYLASEPPVAAERDSALGSAHSAR